MSLSKSHVSTISTEFRSSLVARGRSIEPVGTPLQQSAQKRIHRGRSRLAAEQGAVSFGRSVAVFTPSFDPTGFKSMLEDFRRILVLGASEEAQALVNAPLPEGTDISKPMPIIGADDIEFVVEASNVVAKFKASTNGTISVLADDASTSAVREVQDLQIAVGLTPLPGAFLRGTHGRVSTVLFHDANGDLKASATVVDLSGVSAELAETAILVGVSVAPDMQGRGLGSAITAASLLEARASLGARRIIAVVSPTNTAAFRTNARFGMHPVPGQSALYVEYGAGL